MSKNIYILVCDKDCNSNLISVIEKNNKYYKSTLKQMSLQMVLLANSNARICKGLAYMDKKTPSHYES